MEKITINEDNAIKQGIMFELYSRALSGDFKALELYFKFENDEPKDFELYKGAIEFLNKK